MTKLAWNRLCEEQKTERELNHLEFTKAFEALASEFCVRREEHQLLSRRASSTGLFAYPPGSGSASTHLRELAPPREADESVRVHLRSKLLPQGRVLPYILAADKCAVESRFKDLQAHWLREGTSKTQAFREYIAALQPFLNNIE